MDQKSKIKFRPIPQFGAAEYAFIYYPTKVKTQKLLPLSKATHLLGVEIYQRIIPVYVPEKKTIRLLRPGDFHLNKNSPLPSVSALPDGISRQRIIEEEDNQPSEQTEETLHSALTSLNISQCLSTQLPFPLTSLLTPYKYYLCISDEPPLQQSFQEACKQMECANAIEH